MLGRTFRLGRARAAALLTCAGLLSTSVLFGSTPVSAASLVEITNFGNNPSGLRMFMYVPDRLASPKPAVLVAVHFCTGSGPTFFSGTEFASLADRFGF